MKNTTPFREKLTRAIQNAQSFLCVGLDPEPEKLPAACQKAADPVLEFNRRIIEATKDIVCAYKPNLAFYEALGKSGWETLNETCKAIPKNLPIILDAKRGDIGHTARLYAQALFDQLGGDAVTVNPYLGGDALAPFADYVDRGILVLCLTSNPGAGDFQTRLVNGHPLFLEVVRKVVEWDRHRNFGLVVGATYPDQLQQVREAAGDLPILIPGVGAQGGDLEKSVQYGTRNGTNLAIINVSRAILYASSGSDFAEKARAKALELKTAMLSAVGAKITLSY